MPNKSISLFLMLCCIGYTLVSCAQDKKTKTKTTMTTTNTSPSNLETATFGAGCFWCVEAVYQQLKGVEKVESGYAGGKIANPTYKEICTGLTGHAEVCKITFDPKIVSYKDLLEVFWKTHDPTTLNQQGNDRGTQYRSVVFYYNEEQRKEAEFYKAELDKSGAYNGKIVTEISPIAPFYKAEDYHQDYYNQNGEQPYCVFVVKPKVEKFRKAFANKAK